jgi:hypothetical protein
VTMSSIRAPGWPMMSVWGLGALRPTPTCGHRRAASGR